MEARKEMFSLKELVRLQQMTAFSCVYFVYVYILILRGYFGKNKWQLKD